MTIWGPKMQRVLDWARERGIEYSPMPPFAFYCRICRETNTTPAAHHHPEDVADEWLKAIDALPPPPTNGANNEG